MKHITTSITLTARIQPTDLNSCKPRWWPRVLAFLGAMLALSLLSLHAGPAKIFYPQMVVYTDDFSTDPGWVSNDPANLGRDATDNTFHGHQCNAGSSYAYTSVNWDGKASFQLDYDLKINSCEWSAGCTLGLFGSNLLSGINIEPCIVADFSVTDGGHGVNVFANNGVMATNGPGLFGLWTEGVWYRVSLQYNAVAGLAQLTVCNRTNGQEVAQMSLPIIAPLGSGIPYLGVSRRFMEGYSSDCVDYSLDNVRFAVSVVPPQILVQPFSQIANLGQSLTLSVTAANPGSLTYQWYKDGVAIMVATNSTLVLGNLAISNGGSYTVAIGNSSGSIMSDAAVVTVMQLTTSLAMYAGLTIEGVAGRTYSIQYVADLNQTNWITLTNLTLVTPIQVWIDMSSAGQPKRFYRVTTP